MKRSLLLVLALFLFATGKIYSQALGCLTPTLVLTDPTAPGNPVVAPTLSCSYTGLIRFNSTPVYNAGPTASNKPCLRLITSLTNTNSLTNNTICLSQGTSTITTCTSPSNNILFTWYISGLTPSLSTTYTLCNNAAAPNMQYTVSSCYDNNVITSGTWTNTVANSCQTVFIPANTPMGNASFSISPAVPTVAIVQNAGNGFITLDPWEMAAGIYTVSYTFSTSTCSTIATRTLQITNPFTGAGSSFSVPPAMCPTGPCINLNNQLAPTAFVPGTWSGTGVTSNSFCPSTTGPGTFQITYSVGVTPVCSATNSNVFLVAPQPTANAGPTKSITCAVSSQTLNGSGGGTYSWSHGTLGNNFSTSQNPVIGNQTGTYTLVVSNGTCFSSPSTVNVVTNFAAPALPAIAVSSTINCINTTATVTASGSGITYTWSGPGITSGNGTPTITVNTGGTYNYTVTSTVNGCTSNSNVAVSQNTAVALNITPGAAINCTNNISSLTADQPSYSYTWTAPATGNINSGQSTPTVLITGTGVYSVTVQNPANGCIRTFTALPTTNTAVITPTITTPGSATITCINTSINLNGAPGSGVTYTWSTSNGNITGGTNTQNTTVNAGGIYTLSVTNSTNACVGSRTISIVNNTTTPTNVAATPSNVILACPAQTANIVGTATGASTFSWVVPAGGSILSGQNTATAQVTSSSIGIFTLVATGANGCSATNVVTVAPNTNAPTFSLSNNSPSITCGNNSPSVTVNLTSTVAILSYSWGPSTGISGTTNTSVATFTNPGTYSCVITATNGCISTAVLTVGSATIAPSVVAGTGTAQTISCSNSVVVISPSITPISSNYTYTWTGPGIVGSSNNSSVQVNQPGSYSLVVTETLTGCTTNSIVIPVNGNITTPSLNVTSSSTTGIGCAGANSTVNLTAISNPTYTYIWNTNETTPVITATAAGVYTVTVTDPSSNCSTTETIAVTSNTTVPTFTSSALGALPCGAASGTVQLNATGSSTNISYNWSGTGIISGSNTSNPIVGQAGIYTVVATDNNTGCTGTATVAVINPTVVANFTANVVSGASPLNVDFTNNSLGAISYTWEFGNGSTSTSTNVSTTYTAGGNYTVTLTSSNGICSDTHTLEIKVSGGLGVIPQIFTPNGDGKNDPFYIPGLDNYPKNKLQIFNRWGNIVYEAAPYKNDWDGAPNKSSMGTGKLPVGTYFYILDLGDEKEEIRKGFVQLEY